MVLYLEVSLLHAESTSINRVRRPSREEIVSTIVDHCVRLVAQKVNGTIDDLSQRDFNSDGMTVHLTVGAETHADETIELSVLERSLETNLQSHFGWKRAAISVQIEVDTAPAAWRDWSSRSRAALNVGAMSPGAATEPLVSLRTQPRTS
ncbi:hypothetical protein [Terricaulis sp.]|uniref:hypothetical protein n=1 Tax=Terricaulis sp. TaxID=2768686 RepID=UPI002AC67904|nr:hypothetical protein [Terricaulis sp.]MDZ4690046.1 hypothetical protein [Terricaulis sp.]